MERQTDIPKSAHSVPPGYTLCHDSEGSPFAVPQFLVPAAHTSFDAFRLKNSLEFDMTPEVWVFYFFYRSDDHNLFFKALQKTWIATIIYKCRHSYGSGRSGSSSNPIPYLLLIESHRAYQTLKFYISWQRRKPCNNVMEYR